MAPPTTDQGAIPVLIKSATTEKEPEATIRPSETKTNINRCIVKVTSADISRGYNGQGYNNPRVVSDSF
jgi:hypothetical protein